MKKLFVKLLLPVLVVALFLSACADKTNAGGESSPQKPARESTEPITHGGHPPEINATIIEADDDETISVTGGTVAMIVSFLAETYPQIYTRQLVSEDLGEGRATVYASKLLGLIDIDGSGIPAVYLRFDDAGSWAPVLLKYIDGSYQEVMLPFPYQPSLFYDDEGNHIVRSIYENRDTGEAYDYYEYITVGKNGEISTKPITEDLFLHPCRILGQELTDEINKAVNQKLWITRTLSDGIVVDVNLRDEIIEVVSDYIDENFFEGGAGFIEEIRYSLFIDNVVRVKTVRPTYGDNYHWLWLDNADGIWQVMRHEVSSWFIWTE